MTLIALVAWYLLATAWTYTQGRATTSGVLPTVWHYLLGLVLLTSPWVWLTRGWLQLLLLLPLAVAGLAAWPMAIRVSHRVAAAREEEASRPHPTPDSVARERARGPELEQSRRDTLEIVHQLRSAG